MARARTIKPGYFTNDELCAMAPLVRLLFAGLWCIADKEGRLLDRPRKIKVEVLPYDKLDADAAIKQLCERGFLQRYEVAGIRYIQVVNWSQHQHPHPKEEPGTLPPPPMHGSCMTDASAMDEVCMNHVPTGQSVARASSSSSSSSIPSGSSMSSFSSEDAAPAETAGRPPSTNGTAGYLKTPKGSAAVKDAFKAAGLGDVVFTARDHAAIKHSNAPPELIAEVYDKVARYEYPTDEKNQAFMHPQLSVCKAIEWINGYVEWKAEQTYRNGAA